MEHFASSLQNAVSTVEPENGGGELTIKLPKESHKFVSEKKTFRLSIEFSLEHPRGGIQFVIPAGSGSIEEVNETIRQYFLCSFEFVFMLNMRYTRKNLTTCQQVVRA